MPNSDESLYEQISVDQAARVDAACDRFERSWKRTRTGEPRPDIRAALAEVDEPLRTVLAFELAGLDQAYRRKHGERPHPTDYLGLCDEYDRRLAQGDPTPRIVGDAVVQPANVALRIPGCEIVDVLGSGGMGVVYKAFQPALGRYVAVKALRDDGVLDADHEARFLQEARAIGQLQHPNLVQVYEVGTTASEPGVAPRPYLTLEYLRGGSLADFLHRRTPPPDESARFVEILARAVEHAHVHGVVHRDLKPGNVLLQPVRRDADEVTKLDEAIPKVADFGLARLVGGSRLTHSADALGTPSYMAPEQTRGKFGEVGPTTDVYGLGAILYEMLTGRPPFRAETALATVLQVREADPISVRRLQPTVSRDLETICLKCLQKDQRGRYQSAGALADDLRRYSAGESIVARPVSAVGRAVKWMRRRPAVAGLLAAVVAVAALGAAGVLWQWNRTAVALADSRRAHAETQAQLYFNQIARAQHELRIDRVGGAERLLDEADPAARCWEWHYLKRQCRQPLFVLKGKGSPMQTVAYSADGKLLASGSGDWRSGKDGELTIWDAATGSLLHALSCGGGTVFGVAFHPKDDRLASASYDRIVRIWNGKTGKLLRELPGHTLAVNQVAFSPDGKTLASAGSDKTVRLWDVETGALRRVFALHTYAVWTVAFSPDGKRIASGDWFGVAHIWDPETGTSLRAIKTSRDIRDVEFAPDGKWAAFATFAGGLGYVEIDKPDSQPAIRYLNRGPLLGLAFCPDGRLVWTSRDGGVHLQDRIAGRDLGTYRGHDQWARDVAVSPNGRRLATAGYDGNVGVFALQEEEEPSRNLDDRATISGMTCDPNGDTIVVGSFRRRPTAWNMRTGKSVAALRAVGETTAGAGGADGRMLAWAVGGKTVTAYDRTTGAVVWSREVDGAPVYGLAFSADGKLLAYGGADGRIRLCDAASGAETASFGADDAPLSGVAFGPDNRTLAAAGQDGTVRFWDFRTATLRAQFGGSKHASDRSVDADAQQDRAVPIVRLAFSPDGRRLAVAHSRWTVDVWDVATHRLVFSPLHDGESAIAVAWSPDGWRLSACVGRRVNTWNAEPFDEAERRAASESGAEAWHTSEAAQAEARRDWFAAEYHVAKLIESQPNAAPHYLRRAGFRARSVERVENGWGPVRADLEKAARLSPDDSFVAVSLAVVALQLGDAAQYRALCRNAHERFGTSTNVLARNNVAWMCSLAPGSGVDPVRIEALAKGVADSAPNNLSRLNTWGVALYRAGKYELAREKFARAAQGTTPDGEPWNWLFLAMAEHRLGRPVEAARWLKRADDALAAIMVDQPPPGGNNAYRIWRERMELRLFRAEAAALLSGSSEK